MSKGSSEARVAKVRGQAPAAGPLVLPLVMVAAAACGVAAVATPYMAAATFSYGLLVIGLGNRMVPRLHARYMMTAIGLDLGIVLALEVQRHAIATAVSLRLSPLQQAHVAMSSLATVLYLPVLYLGWRQLRGEVTVQRRHLHVRLGIAAFVCRTLGFLLMFTLLSRTRS